VDPGENEVVNFAGVGPVEPATVTIQSITQGGAPIVLTNVAGQIEVTLNVTRGDRDLDKVDILIDDAVVASQTFAAPPAPAEATGEEEVITLNVPTNQVRMGDNTYVPVVFNGGANVSANLYEVGVEAPIPTNDVPVIMNNVDVLMSSDGGLIPGIVTRDGEGGSPITVGGNVWDTGGLMYDGPIYISFSTTVQTASWTACGAGGVGAVVGTAATGITLSNTWACATTEAINQGPGIALPAGYTGVALGPDGTPVTLPAAWSALGAMFTLDSESRWYVLTPGPAGLTPPAVFDIDNVGPTITIANGTGAGNWGVAFSMLFDQPWVNASYAFLQDGTWVDGGVGVDLATRMTHLWVQGTPGSCSGADVTTGDDLAETIASDGTPDGYQI
jgi:hypothetical protein